MKTRTIATLSCSVLLLGGVLAGYTGSGGIAFAGEQNATKIAAKQFDQARKSLARGKADAAIGQAESAVGYDPQVAAYRVLLGQAYLKAGRFGSARAAFADALTLEPGNGKAALNLALAEIAEGNWDGARRTLDANAATIPISDRGLAVALAGDPATAVELLESAARAPEADAKTRQNFALALALAGRWADAKTVVAMDLAPDQVDARILEWASFAKPSSASDQVASLLGVTPVADPGQPVRLALNGGAPVGLAAAPVDDFMPGNPVEPVAVASAALTPVIEPTPVVASVSNVSFGPRYEVVQAQPPRAMRAGADQRNSAFGVASAQKAVFDKAKPMMGAAVAPKPQSKGNYFVQLGAFDNAAVARDAWGRLARAHSALAGHNPSGAAVQTKAGNFYRLSLGGFARGDAAALCQSYKARGGNCFVRAAAGDKMAAWVKQGAQLASR
ncbi:SPOR domain-containing protein [Sphingomonas sp. PB4P5]|uniref:SPOR domain-containing protein n=1 Tax=Parasphingomonas puruogangriensis TaxID=3096155 RepID=UPI002FC8E67D